MRLPTELGLRLLALVLAVALWFVAAEERGLQQASVEERVVPAAVRLAGVAPNLVPVRTPPAVEVRLRVPAGMQPPEQLEAVADLTGRQAGTHKVPISVNAPAGFTVLGVEPPQVSVQLEREIARSYPVEIAITGLSSGLTVRVEGPDPPTVTLEGAESRINQVVRVLAVTRYAPRGTSTQVTVHPVDAAGASVSGLTITPQQVTVAFDLPAPMSAAPPAESEPTAQQAAGGAHTAQTSIGPAN